MGDVIHALPVVSDIAAALPHAQVDWVVEESFADLPRLHPRVNSVVTVALRRWRRAPLSAQVWAEVGALRTRLRAQHYDRVLDLQGLIKSAWVARWAGAPVAGYARQSAREPLAAWAYAQRYAVDTTRTHAIEKMRSLAAQALGYEVQGLPHFGLAVPPGGVAWLTASRYAVLLHATSRAEKHWPAQGWTALGQALVRAGVVPVLTWGSAPEFEAAKALAAGIEGAVVAPKLSLAQCAQLLAGAEAVVGVDTGLTHLAAALDVRTVALFAATESWRYGPYWSERARNLGEGGHWPGADEVVAALAALGVVGLDGPGRPERDRARSA